MGKFCDYVINWNPETESPEVATERIFYSVFVKRLKANKPVVIFVGGGSGEGKSWATLRMQEILCKVQGINALDHVHDMNVYTPLEYPKKLERLLDSKELKKVNILCTHEARTLVRAKNWHSFINEAIGDVNAMSRSIKRLCFIVISQFIRDITTDVRYTLNFYCTVDRPNQGGTKLKIKKIYLDDSDLEKPKMKTRGLIGWYIDNKGRYHKHKPAYFELSKPNKELREAFDKADTEAKTIAIHKRMEKLIAHMSKEFQAESQKVDTMVEWYIKNVDQLNRIGKMSRGKWIVKKEVADMHELTKEEAGEFQLKLNERMKEAKMI